MLWPAIALAAGTVMIFSGAALAGRIFSRGVRVEVDQLTKGQWLSGALMLYGWVVIGIGLVWLLVVGVWRLVT